MISIIILIVIQTIPTDQSYLWSWLRIILTALSSTSQGRISPFLKDVDLRRHMICSLHLAAGVVSE